jgi:tRNA (guanine-N7-)-methyltransferase
MSRKRKLQKFADLVHMTNVYELIEVGNPILSLTPFEQREMRGKWNELHFKNNHPLIVELACGRGEYVLGLADLYPHKNFVGVDIKGARIWKGARIAAESNLNQVAFLRIRIEQIHLYFDVEEIDEIWITFPDPFPAKENRRLTSPRFLNVYKDLLKPGGIIHLKTDDDDLFSYSLETIRKSVHFKEKVVIGNVHDQRDMPPSLTISTYYERIHIENKKTIKYFAFDKID